MAVALDLLRHAQAVPAGPDGDRRRGLSPEGRRGLTALAARLARQGWRPDRVFSSPYARALDSARIVAGAAAPPVEVETLEALEPGNAPTELLAALRRRGVTGGHVLLVGHQPLLGLLARCLTGVEPGIAPGALVRIQCPGELDPGTGQIAWTDPPGTVEP